jgi:hypothetical protein
VEIANTRHAIKDMVSKRNRFFEKLYFLYLNKKTVLRMKGKITMTDKIISATISPIMTYPKNM